MIRWIRRIVAGLLAYFSIFPLWVAFGYLRLAVERWFGHPYYLGHSHFERGCFWLLIGLAVLLPAVYCALSRRASAWWLGLGFGAALLAAIALPSNVLPTMLVPRAEETLTARARNLANALENRDANQGRLPANQTELVEIAANAEGASGLMGPYYRNGAPAPIQIVYVGGATGPILVEPSDAAMPAAIYCAVSSDQTHFWITGTMLDREVGGHSRWLREIRNGTDRSAQPLVIGGSIGGVSHDPQRGGAGSAVSQDRSVQGGRGEK